MSKTFLQLAVALRQEVLASGTGPATVVSQTGELKRIVDWIAEADEEIQQEHDEWKFMVGDFTLNTVADDGSYAASDCVTPITDLRNWKLETFKIYLLASGVADEVRLCWMDYQLWYETYNTGSQTSGRPKHFTIGNDMSIKLGPKPSAVYRVSGEYQKSVDTMTANEDVPVYPSEFHNLPLYLGMMKYGRSTGAAEVFQDGERLYNKMLRRMERSQLPRVRTAGALA
jgi:hypothetical protein